MSDTKKILGNNFLVSLSHCLKQNKRSCNIPNYFKICFYQFYLCKLLQYTFEIDTENFVSYINCANECIFMTRLHASVPVLFYI